MISRPLILGSRGSALALAQVELTRRALADAFPGLEVEVRTFVTRGDQKLDLSLLRSGEAGGKGLFTKELEDALLAGTIDLAVHSLKDLPGHMPEGLALAGVLERAATADVLVSKLPGGLDGLPHGALVGTSSVRRARQLRWRRPDLQICEWRGNVGTRLRKLGEFTEATAIVLAQAGLERLGFAVGQGRLAHEDWSFHLAPLGHQLLPAIGQGAIALQSRTGDLEVLPLVAEIDHGPTHLCVRAERELQRLLAGDCTLPVGVRTGWRNGALTLEAVLFTEEAEAPRVAQTEGPATDPENVAREAFAALSAPSARK